MALTRPLKEMKITTVTPAQVGDLDCGLRRNDGERTQ